MADDLKFTTDDLEITPEGRIVINNASVAKALIGNLKMIDPAAAAIFDNCDCKRGVKATLKLSGKLPKRELSLSLPEEAAIFDNCDCRRK